MIPGASEFSEQFFEWRRTEFPFFERKTFLTHASVSPLPAHVAGSIADFTLRLATEGQFDYFALPVYRRCKERIAALLANGARPENVAFAGSTSHALGLVATSLDWREGENCVVCDGDFPANVVTWKNLAHTHGVEVRIVPRKAAHDIEIADLAPFVDEKTRVVSLSATHFLTGYTLDLNPIGDWLHERGVLLCVDAIQALGALQIDLSRADFVCADAHKWLLGPNGAAFAWFSPAAMERMRPQILGWLACDERDDWFAYSTAPHPSAERFEPGARNYLGIVGLDAALEIFLQAGLNAISARVTHLRNHAARVLEESGVPLLWTPDEERIGGIVTFQAASREKADTERLYRHLDRDFALSLRNGPDGHTYIRVSPHFMNCEDDLNRLGEAIRGFSS